MQISVKVTAGARKEEVVALKNNRFKISVKARAEAGAANERMVELVAKHFGVAQKKVRIIKGHKTPSKILEVRE
jgi:uncharacterized protein (TIGR00251 family)